MEQQVLAEKMYYVIHSETGARLCQDGRWREHHAPFGTFSSCVKVYKQRGWAERRANRLGNTAMVLFLARHLEMDAAGHVYDEGQNSKRIGHCLDMKPRRI